MINVFDVYALYIAAPPPGKAVDYHRFGAAYHYRHIKASGSLVDSITLSSEQGMVPVRDRASGGPNRIIPWIESASPTLYHLSRVAALVDGRVSLARFSRPTVYYTVDFPQSNYLPTELSGAPFCRKSSLYAIEMLSRKHPETVVLCQARVRSSPPPVGCNSHVLSASPTVYRLNSLALMSMEESGS
ncbi:hypothetical protein RRG08_001605 [Elysia crispata]|uniref:Uncharacterized protein n=1 Tax=Elysia crispata TaxID=231223 RepID=A0AAE1AJV4_9GAST|nr:hypothetical protein RRG08_001605 [Elysia crispata]